MFPSIYTLAWFYATVQPAFHAFTTIPTTLLFIHLFSLLSSLGTFYQIGSFQGPITQATLIFQIVNAAITLSGLVIISSARFRDNGEPTVDRDGFAAAGDDYVTLWGWFTFGWMTKFVSIGDERPLEDSDIWQLSQLLRTRTLMAKFRTYKQKTLLRRLLYANALDMTINYTLSVRSRTRSSFVAPITDKYSRRRPLSLPPYNPS